MNITKAPKATQSKVPTSGKTAATKRASTAANEANVIPFETFKAHRARAKAAAHVTLEITAAPADLEFIGERLDRWLDAHLIGPFIINSDVEGWGRTAWRRPYFGWLSLARHLREAMTDPEGATFTLELSQVVYQHLESLAGYAEVSPADWMGGLIRHLARNPQMRGGAR